MRFIRFPLIAAISFAVSGSALAGGEKACKADPRGNAWGYWRQCGSAAASVDVNGGTIETLAGASVSIPFGAVDEPVTVTVETTALAAPPELGAVSPVYGFGPDGTVFAKPVTVTLPLPPGVTRASIYLTKLGSTEFEPIGGTISGGFITAETPHFSLAVIGAESPVRTVNGVGSTTWISATHREIVANDYGATPAEAIVRDTAGNLVAIPAIPGAKGTFTIPDVPAGEYVLHAGKQYLVTSTNSPDLGSSRGGRPDATPLTGSALIDLSVTNLTPWAAGSSLELFATEADDWDFNTERFALSAVPPQLGEGQTSLAFTFDLAEANGAAGARRIEGARGDRLHFAQLAAATSANGWPYTAMSRLVQFASFDVVPGAAVSVSGTMLDVQQAKTIAADWRASAFKAEILTGANPNVVFDCQACGGFFGVLAQAGTSADGFYTSNADLLLLYEREGRDVQSGAMSYGSPASAGLDGAWGEIGHVRWFAGVHYQLPGLLPTSGTLGNGISWTANATELAAPMVLAPPISFARTVLVDGRSFFADATLSTATPTIQWEPPSIGSPTHYVIVVTEVVSGPAGQRTVLNRDVVRIVTPNTSFTFLPGILQPGRVYALSLRAVDAPAAINAPFRTVLTQKIAEVSSGMLTVPVP